MSRITPTHRIVVFDGALLGEHGVEYAAALVTWHDGYARGQEVDRAILALSTYLGHAKVTDTYWYVTATPGLVAIATRRFAAGCHGGTS